MFRHIIKAVIAVFLIGSFAWADSDTVLVFPFENQSNDRNLDWIGEGIAELIVARLQTDPALYVFSRDERLAGFETMGIPEGAVVSRATAMHLGWNLGGDKLITGRFTGTSDNFCIYARVIDLKTSASGPEFPIPGKLEDIIPLSNKLSDQLLKILVPWAPAPTSDVSANAPIPRSAFENYIRGMLVQDPQRRSDYLSTALRLHPDYPEALFQLGREQYIERDFKNSNLHLQKIAKSSPDYLQAQFMIGLNHYRLEDYARAVAVLSALPQTFDVSIDLGVALAGKGDTTAAVATWKHSMDLDPFSVDAPFNIGYLSFNKGDNETAIKMFEQSLKLQGRDAEAMFLLARSYERAGRVDEAQKTMAQATRLSTRVERWQTQPPTKLERLRDLQDPLPLRASEGFHLWTGDRLARRAKGRDVNAWLESVQTQIDSQMYGDAIRDLQNAFVVFPNSSDAHLLLAQVYQGQKNYDGALNEIEHAIGIRKSAESYILLARTYRSLNQLPLALHAVTQALDLAPNHAAALALKTALQRQMRQTAPAPGRPLARH